MRYQEVGDNEEDQIKYILQADHWGIHYIKNPCELACVAAVLKDFRSIAFINYPSEAVQLIAINDNASIIRHINSPSQTAIRMALTNQQLIDDTEVYNHCVELLFANNSLLMNKWLRPGEVMRTNQ
jgi:hypothetical protein